VGPARASQMFRGKARHRKAGPGRCLGIGANDWPSGRPGVAADVSAVYPPVGVPDPIAIEKMCIAVIPLPTVALTVGSVTDATFLPACSGTEAK